jgi:hypothetical protein
MPDTLAPGYGGSIDLASHSRGSALLGGPEAGVLAPNQVLFFDPCLVSG